MLNNPKLGVALTIVMAVSMWFYVNHILIPYQVADAALHQTSRNIISDLYPRWYGSKELLLHHRNPYGPAVSREIQVGCYGHPLDPSRADDPKDEQRFAYPVYVAFFLAPTVTMPFTIVRRIFVWILVIATVAGVLWWMRALRWRPGCWGIAMTMILTLSGFGTVQGIKLQQLSLLVAALVAAAAVLLTGGQLFFAGVVLALATIKAQLVILPVAWLFLWAASDWKRRSGFVWGFFIAGGLLAAGGFYLLPNWFGEFIRGLVAYNRYTGGRSLFDELISPRSGGILAVLFLIASGAVGWKLRRASAGSEGFNLALALSLAVTIVVAPMISPYNHVLLLPAIFLIAQAWPQLWRANLMNRIFCATAAAIFFWPWMSSMALTLLSTLLPPTTIQKAWTVPLWSSLGIPLAVLGLLALCIANFLKENPGPSSPPAAPQA